MTIPHPIPLPERIRSSVVVDIQKQIVAEIEAEQALVNASRELMRCMEARVKAAIDRVSGS